MAWNKKQEPEPLAEEFKPNLRDALDLGRKLLKYSPRKINGRNQYPFQLYLEEEKVIRFGDFGEAIILKPMEYTRLAALNDLLEWKRDKDLGEVLKTMPEEKAAHEDTVGKIREEIRALFKGALALHTPKV